MDDNRIITLFWNRDENAISEADAKYHGLCFRIALNILADCEDSEECVNDTWFAAWNYIPPQIPRCLSAFLSKITRGKAIDALRSRNASKRVPRQVCEVIDETRQLNKAVGDFVDNLVESQNLVKIFEDFLDHLSARDRDIFVQRYWYIMPVDKIVKRHRMAENAVRQNLLRSRRKLQRILEKEGYF